MSDLETTPDGRVVETRRSGGGGWLIAVIIIVGLVVAAFAFGFINIDQVREGKAPTVKLETSGGQAPKFDIDTAKIAIGKKEETVTVPTVTMERADDPNKQDK
ncbi:MAG: hypothetical protein RL490_106 [Pseudomonadota bacterium]|jgi:hypothetical protein